MKRLTKVLCYLGLPLFIVLGVGYALLMQSTALVHQSHFLNADSAMHSQALAQRLLTEAQRSNNNQDPILLRFSELELQGLSSLSHRAIPKLSSALELSPSQLKVALTYEVDFLSLQRFINIDLHVLSSTQGLRLSEIKVGEVSISQDWFFNVFRWGINSQVKEGLGDTLIEAIQSVELADESVELALLLPTDLTSQSTDKYALFKELRDKLAVFGDVDKIRYYYQHIVDFSGKLSANHSLSRYISFAFTQAKLQTSQLGNTTAVIENRAALTALTLFFGPEKFMLLVGDMPPPSLRETSRRHLLQNIITLHNRVDLQKHYIYSIMLQLLGTQDASDAMGEMKEFLDSHQGGSGFSFVDLLADRAGTRLAFSATHSEPRAIYIQKLMDTDFNEAELIPSVRQLPESISQVEFEKRFEDVNSLAYKNVLKEIDERLYQLALYQ